MKRALLTVFAICSVFISGCKKDDIPEPVKPTDIISKAEAQAVAGDGYELILEYGAVVDLGNNTYKSSYVSEVLGKGDPIIVEVTYPSETLSRNDIKKIYFKSYDSRVNKREINGIGSEAFVAFPTLNILEDGHFIRITAGSGDTREQLDMLLSLGRTAVGNLQKYLNNDN